MKKIEVNNVSFKYSDMPSSSPYVLDHISFTANANENIGLIGANGIGKSTLLKILVGLLEHYEGNIAIDGMDLHKENLAKIRERIGYVFQDSDSQLFMSSVYEDVAFGPRNYGYSLEEVDQRVMEALQMVHIEKLKDRQIYRMSGGQKKLASLATILALQPEIILLDEPSVALDPRNRRNLIAILKELPGLKFIATHDLDMVQQTCQRTILLSDGMIVKDGPTEEVLKDTKLLELSGL